MTVTAIHWVALAIFLNGLVLAPTFAQDRPPAPVAVFEAVQRDIAAGQTFVATVRPLKRVIIGSAVDGRVVELAAHEGDRIEQGKPLVLLLTETIKLELAEAEAQLELLKHQLDELENGTRPDDIEQAKARMQGAETRMKYDQGRLERLERLRESKAAAQGEYDEALAASLESEQVYSALKAAYQLSVAGPRPESIAQARARVAVQQASIERIRDRMKKYTMQSRFDGYVVTEFTEEGAWVKSGDPVMEVVGIDEVDVHAFIPEDSVRFVVPGTHVRVEVPALPDRVFTGTVSTIIPQADTRARTFPVKVRVTNEISDAGPVLKSGMYARIELPTGAQQQAVMVPKDALVLGGPQPSVYVVDRGKNGQGIVRPVPVQPGVATTNLIQVKGDLQPGQLVVVEGNERLRPGQEVSISRVVSPHPAAASAQ